MEHHEYFYNDLVILITITYFTTTMYFPCNAYMFDDGLQLASDPNHNHVLYYNHVWSWFPIGWSWFMIGLFPGFRLGGVGY